MAQVRKFFIGSTEIQIEISPQLASTLDETLDNLQVTQVANSIANPYTPFQKFYIKDENNNVIQTFIISADSVELATENPLRYKHHISLVQESEFLTKHEIRNTVFSSDRDNELLKIIGATAYLKKDLESRQDLGNTPVPVGFFYYNDDAYEYAVNPQPVTIDLSKKSVSSIDIAIDFAIEKVYKQWADTSRTNGRIYGSYEKPTKWSNVYTNASSQPTTYPTIRFTIGAETRDLVLNDADYSNGDIVQLPNNIKSWIQGFTSGTLTITLLNATGKRTFMESQRFTDLSLQDNPWLVNINFSFYISTQSKDYNIYSVIDTLLKQQMKETNAYNSGNDATIKPLFLLPTLSHNPDLYNLLKGTQVPNLIFTQCSMYDALVEVFKLFDAIFTIDNDGYLDIEYFNESAQSETTLPSIAGKSTSLAEERFTNQLITYFQNTKINHKFPNSNDENAVAYLRSKSMGVPSENDYVFVVPKNIDLVTSVKIKANITFERPLDIDYYNDASSILPTPTKVYLDSPVNEETLDITPFVVEETIWSTLSNLEPPINSDWANLTKFNTLTYRRGSNYISVSEYKTTTLNEKKSLLSYVLRSAFYTKWGISDNTGIFDLTTPNWRDVKLAVKYIALVDGKLVNESLDFKYKGETLINQSNGSIDINKLGLNMVGLSLKLGQPTLNMTQVFSSWDDRVKKGQYFVDANGDRWVANNCVYTIIKPDLIQTNIEFIKNFNGLAKRIELNNEKRLSNISNELTIKCEETYGEYVYYSSREITEDAEPIAFNPEFLANQIAMGFGTMLDQITIDQTRTIITNLSTISAVMGLTHTQKELYSVSGYVEGFDASTGVITLNDQSDFSGNQLVIPWSSTNANALRVNNITGDLQLGSRSAGIPYVATGDAISISLVISSNDVIIGGAITLINSSTTDFSPVNVPVFIPKNTYTIEYALITSYDANGNIINLGANGNVQNVAIPLMVYGSGNSICFEMSFNSPIAAGTQLLDNYTSDLWTGGWFSKYVLYADEEGKADAFTIQFIKMQEETTRYYPEMKSDPNTLLATYEFGKLEQFKYYKKPNEVFALNYQLHFMPINKMRDFLSNEWIKNNAFANGINKAKLKIITSTNADIYSILDTKGEGDNTYEIATYGHGLTNLSGETSYTLTFIVSQTISDWDDIKSWAIVDENNNIYFATNTAPSKISTYSGIFKIYFKSRHHRLS